MRRPPQVNGKLMFGILFFDSYEPCFHTHSLKSHWGSMQKEFLIQALVLLSVPRAWMPQYTRAVTRKNGLFFISTEVFWSRFYACV
jgi:hypothetical protein